jgi:hypothetical protein
VTLILSRQWGPEKAPRSTYLRSINIRLER